VCIHLTIERLGLEYLEDVKLVQEDPNLVKSTAVRCLRFIDALTNLVDVRVRFLSQGLKLRLRWFLYFWQFGVFLALPAFDDLEATILVVGSILSGSMILTAGS
jgi:hypothetical protein